ncbi:MAG: hypothetical protein IPJ19_19960 [Planctomycetes bacterium]|nr:hypothetical protein [Planctomycetota bacterium]
MKRALFSLGCLLVSACAGAPQSSTPAARAAPAARHEDLSHQILWQRSLEDALALAKSSGRPLLVAMNMDGESASERITKENYRDPEFVALTRNFVCILGSAFRHNLRDYDEQGRRIPCPRLGSVTCGEHIALEPILFDKYLGGERIAPRHALIQPDGTKNFDEFLLWDLHDLYRIFADAAPKGDPAPAGPGGLDLNLQRLAQEDALAASTDPRPALARFVREQDHGAIDALIRLSVRPELNLELARTARTLGLEKEYGAWLRTRVAPGDLAALAELDPAPAVQTRIAGAQAVVAAGGGLLPLAQALERSQQLIGVAAISDERAPGDLPALEEELQQADEALQKTPDSAAARARFGRVSLALARTRVEAGFTRDVPFLLQDAERWLAKAAELQPESVEIALERAEASYRLSDFGAEERHALEALEWSGAGTAQEPTREQREALRWVGDAAARDLEAHFAGDPSQSVAAVLRGALALQRIALTNAAGESDWLALASFHGLLGLVQHEVGYLQAAVERLPESQALRAALADACWRAADLEPLTRCAEVAVTLHEDSAAAQWYLGVAWIQRAEWARRAERVPEALREYQGAERAFERCAELEPKFAENCMVQRAHCHLGQGFAHLLVDERADGAQELVAALKLSKDIAGWRDGLDREPIDLLDQSLEWRASGPSSVNAIELLGQLEAAAPGDAYWPRWLADTELREARRADHREVTGLAMVYTDAAISAARHALELEQDDEIRLALRLPLLLQADLFLAKDELDAARAPLGELAGDLGLETPKAADDLAGWKALAARLNQQLGEAAPVNRPGR